MTAILHSALHHTLHIIIFILAVNLILGFVMEFAGIDAVKTIMMSDSAFQPFIAAIVGFIPNCAASVVLTQLYMQDIVRCAYFGTLHRGRNGTSGTLQNKQALS